MARFSLMLFALMVSVATAYAVPVPVPAPHTQAVGVKPSAGGQKASRSSAEPAAQLTHEDVIEAIEQKFQSTRTLIADFVQTTGDGKRSIGKLYMQRPGKFLFRYTDPATLEVAADGRSIAIRDQKLKTQDLYPLSQTPLQFLTRDKIALERDAQVLSTALEGGLVLLRIEEKNTLGGRSLITLMFDAKTYDLVQWTVVDAQGFETNVALMNLDMVSKPDPKLFVIDQTRILRGGS